MEVFLNKKGRWLIILLSPLFMHCAINPYTDGTLYQISSRPLSLNTPDFKTCVFDPQYSIVHFPMWHRPPDNDYNTNDFEIITRSQFQLLHTIIDYNRNSRKNLAVFDEFVTNDNFNELYLQRIESGEIDVTYENLGGGQIWKLNERIKTANNLFKNGFPQYYEYMNPLQKEFIFQMGASLTLYFLREIPKVHKTISLEQYKIVQANLKDPVTGLLNLEGKEYWIFNVREESLRQEVTRFWSANTNSLILIAYGEGHNLQPLFTGWPFQSGHGFCLNWLKSFNQSPLFPI